MRLKDLFCGPEEHAEGAVINSVMMNSQKEKWPHIIYCNMLNVFKQKKVKHGNSLDFFNASFKVKGGERASKLQ